MRLFEKYNKLRQRSYVIAMVTKSVYGSMALENQHVPEWQIKSIVTSLLEEAEQNGRKFDI